MVTPAVAHSPRGVLNRNGIKRSFERLRLRSPGRTRREYRLQVAVVRAAAAGCAGVFQQGGGLGQGQMWSIDPKPLYNGQRELSTTDHGH
jgi:hypothetical protein